MIGLTIVIACGPCALDRSQRGGELAIIARDVTVTAGSAGAVHAAKPAPLSMSMSRAALVVALRADLRHGSEEQAGVEVQACEVVVCCGSCRAESMRDQDPRRRFQRVHRRHASRQHIRRCGHWGYMNLHIRRNTAGPGLVPVVARLRTTSMCSSRRRRRAPHCHQRNVGCAVSAARAGRAERARAQGFRYGTHNGRCTQQSKGACHHGHFARGFWQTAVASSR